jgi:hypothetical protein
MRSILSFDIHHADRPKDIEACARWLEDAGITAAFFIPTSALTISRLQTPLRTLAAHGHELGTHTHHHSDEEIRALRTGDMPGLAFLSESAEAFADFFGFRPRIFRSPCWCYLSIAAREELARLGYHVDSSSTPQRPGVLSHFVWDNRHLAAGRVPHFIAPGLLEIPQSTLLVPLSWPVFCTFREAGTRVFLGMLMLEAYVRRSVTLVPQFHVSDFALEGEPLRHEKRSWRDLIPRASGGIQARRWFRLADRRRLVGICNGVVSALAKGEFTTYETIYQEMTQHVRPVAVKPDALTLPQAQSIFRH